MKAPSEFQAIARGYRDRCIALLPIPPRIVRSNELWCAGILEALPETGAARDAWMAAERVWWALALTQRSVAGVEARAAEGALWTSRGLEKDDLESEGLIGVYRAAQTWDPAVASSWATYARRGARTAVYNAIHSDRGSRDAAERAYRAERTRTNLAGADLPCADDDVAREMGITAAKVASVCAIRPVYSLDEPSGIRAAVSIYGADSDRRLIDTLAHESESADSSVARTEEAAIVRDGLSAIRPRDAIVLLARANDEAAADTAARLGITKQRLWQITARGLAELAAHVAARLDRVPLALLSTAALSEAA